MDMAQAVLQGITLSCTEDEVKVDGRKIATARMERKMLLFLLQNPNVAVSRERLLREVWGYGFGGATRTVDTHVKNLRAHLGALGAQIATVRGVGYRLDTDWEKPPLQKGVHCRGDVPFDAPARAAFPVGPGTPDF